MSENTPQSKLDENVKNTLSEYEAPFDASDWSRMETMLDAAPKSSTFNWSTILPFVAGLVLIGGIYGLYVTFGGKKDKEIETNPPTENVVNEKPVPSPVKVTPPPPSEPSKNITPVLPETKKEEPVVKEKQEEKIIAAPVTKKPEPANVKEKTKTKKEKPSETPIIEPHDKILQMGNEPVFGDMLDSSKGIIGETKEKEETKKAAKAKKNTPVGWNQFMTPHMNVDSMRKVREQRDSTKNQ